MICRMFGRISIVFVLGLLGGCAIPTAHGPYYHPIYPEMNSPDSPWLPYFGSVVQSRLRFKLSEHCFMQLQAMPSDSDLILSWFLDRPERVDSDSGRKDLCNYVVGNEELLLEDSKTVSQRRPASVHRIFFLSPELDFSAGMRPYSSSFYEIPAEQQTYTIAIRVRLDVDRKIPSLVSIKLPDILIANQRMPIPVLNLKMVETGGNIKAYVPVNQLPITNAESITAFAMNTTWHATSGSMGMFHAGATLWHEEKGIFRVASSISGRDDVKTSTMIKPGISGVILIQVMSGKPIAFSESRATWIAADGKETVQHIDERKLELVAYRTKLTDVGRFAEMDFGPRFFLVFPDFQPERARLTLPRLEAVGKIRSIKPIDFEYKPGGVGFAPWP
jgi:hypothetical protein